MFCRVIRGLGWPTELEGQVPFSAGRLLTSYTTPEDQERFKPNGRVDVAALSRMPALFMSEGRSELDFARVGTITDIRIGRDAVIDYRYDTSVPPIPQDRLAAFEHDLGFSQDFEWNHSHLTVRAGDLYRSALRAVIGRQNAPNVFTVSLPPAIDSEQLSVMMPFDVSFRPVYEAIAEVARSVGMRCNRGDDVWDHSTIIQDIASLIDRSRIIVADCTGRNPNVFYEIGIAHALGREVILLAQHESDVPFDLRHLRYIRYLPNTQGLADLSTHLARRIGTLLEQ